MLEGSCFLICVVALGIQNGRHVLLTDGRIRLSPLGGKILEQGSFNELVSTLANPVSHFNRDTNGMSPQMSKSNSHFRALVAAQIDMSSTDSSNTNVILGK
jgi:hypothetical protein